MEPGEGRESTDGPLEIEEEEAPTRTSPGNDVLGCMDGDTFRVFYEGRSDSDESRSYDDFGGGGDLDNEAPRRGPRGARWSAWRTEARPGAGAPMAMLPERSGAAPDGQGARPLLGRSARGTA
jgi:hypothetical protein